MRTPTTIAARLRWARLAAGLEPRELSKRAGLKSSTHVGLIEAEFRRAPAGATIAKLARALGVSMEWLQTGDGVMPDRAALRAVTAKGAA